MDFDEILAYIVGLLIAIIIVLIVVLFASTPSALQNENCIYYEKEIYCKENK